tara:strand:- start:3523 stop:3726 length:204 start_codon:yes stop_codon:yes gene_type:complete
MPQMPLTRMPSDTPVVLTFAEDTEFNIDESAERATILALYRNGSQHVVHVRETRQEIIDTRRAALLA